MPQKELVRPSGTRTHHLRLAVYASFAVQVALSFGLFFITEKNQALLQTAAQASSLTARNSSALQDLGITIRRMQQEINKPNPNGRLIRQTQTQVARQTSNLRSILAAMEVELESHAQSLRLGNSADKFLANNDRLSAFLDDLQEIAEAELNRLPLLTDRGRRLEMAIAPTGDNVRAFNEVAEDMRDAVAVTRDRLDMLKSAILGVIVMTLALLAVLLILPAIRRFEAALEKEERAKMAMEKLAKYDALTGLLNRDGFDDVVVSLTSQDAYAYAIIDLNMFKPINDTYGHWAGDAVLIAIADRLQKVCHGPVVPARIGGDEFVALHKQAQSQSDCEELGAALVSVFDDPIAFETRELKISAAIGIAQSNQMPGDFATLTKAADAAMYTQKGLNRTAFALYSDDISIKVADLSRKVELEQALQNSEIRPWFQPQLGLKNGTVVGFEALARWYHTTGKVLTPKDFIEDIDEFGLQADFTFSMLTQVMVQMRHWMGMGYECPRISVNLSEATLASISGYEGILWRIEEFAELKPFLTFEITEDVFLSRIADSVHKAIQSLTDQGIEFSLDDFGTGYASFRHLSEFTFHELKIDQHFIRQIGVDPKFEVILEAFIAMARGLGVKIVAEGIETEQQRDHLKRIGCDIGQGYLFSRPMPVEDMPDWLTPTLIQKQKG